MESFEEYEKRKREHKQTERKRKKEQQQKKFYEKQAKDLYEKNRLIRYDAARKIQAENEPCKNGGLHDYKSFPVPYYHPVTHCVKCNKEPILFYNFK